MFLPRFPNCNFFTFDRIYWSLWSCCYYIYRGSRPSLPLSCVTESAIIFYYELYLKYFRNKTWQCQRRVNKGRDGGAATRDGLRSASVTCSRKVSNVVHHFLKISQKLCHFQTSKILQDTEWKIFHSKPSVSEHKTTNSDLTMINPDRRRPIEFVCLQFPDH